MVKPVYPIPNWRNDSGLESVSEYKKKFAIIRKICSDGSVVWLKTYYKKYIIWSHSSNTHYYDENYRRKEFVENVSESEYIIRVLSGNL